MGIYISERERERERVSSACGGIWVFIIYMRKVSVLFGFIVTLLPSNGGWAYISNSVRERGGEGVGSEIERDIGR